MKIGAVIRITAMASIVAVLAACSTTSSATPANSGGKATAVLNYWLWQDNATDQTWAALATEFNAQSKTGKVKLQVIPLAQYEDKMLNALASGSGPDAARFKDEWLGQFVKAKAIAPLTKQINAWPGKADVIPTLFASGQVAGDSAIYMLPNQYTTLYMYYRPSIFAAAGLPAPQTEADVLHAASVLKAKGKFAIDVRGGSGGQDQWAAWMLAGGAKFLNGTNVVIDNKTALTVNQEYLDLAGKLGATPPGSITANFASVENNFLNGTTAMFIHHVGSLAAVRAALKGDVKAIPMPGATAPGQGTLGTMSGNVVLAGSQQQGLAWDWISWLDAHNQMLKLSTSPQGQLPVLTSVAKDKPFSTDPALKVAVAAESYATSWPGVVGTSTVVNKDWEPTIQSAFEGQTSNQRMLTSIASDLTGH
jgi:multiple sugar transport system substrate-binding protein